MQVRTPSSSLRAPWRVTAHAFQRAKVTKIAKLLPYQLISNHFHLNMANASDLPLPPLQEDSVQESSPSLMIALKLVAASVLLISAVTKYTSNNNSGISHAHRRLALVGDTMPSYMNDLFQELKERKRLMEETPPEEVKYWFEYTGPLQVSGNRPILWTLEICMCNNCWARGLLNGFFYIGNGEMRNPFIS